MATAVTINKSSKPTPAEDFNFLRREGIKNIEDLAGEVWTDYNTHDPGITLLEALCYAITDLAYRTGFDMKDLLAQQKPGGSDWKNIFYTAREILPCNPLTINDYRKLVMDVKGVRNAWITISKDAEVPLFINQTRIKEITDNPPEEDGKVINACDCGDKVKFPYPNDDEPTVSGLLFPGDIVPGTTDKYKIIELNGLYKIIVEYEEDIIEKHQEHTVRQQVLKVLHRHRNVGEDFLSVTGAEYKDFFLQTAVMLGEHADADKVLAEICYRIQNYFTPVIKFYSLDELLEKGKPVDELFEGPALKHGFILDEELEKTDMFRDMRLSDIINFVSDIEGVNTLQQFKIVEAPVEDDVTTGIPDSCSNEEYFDEWIDRTKNEKLVGRLNVDDMMKFFHPSEDDLITPVSNIHFYKPSGEVFINTDRFLKLLNDLKGRDKYMKMTGFKNNFPVPVGENMELENFYPVQYELPFNYRVGESGLPLREGKSRLIQSLQLKGYLAVFEQLFLNYMYQLNNLNELFSFNDIKFGGNSKHKPVKSACEPDEDPEHKKEEQEEFLPAPFNRIIYKDEEGKIVERIIGYKCLYADVEKYLTGLQDIIQPEHEFEWQRNNILDHLLARFNESMEEYVSLMKYMYPDDYLIRVIKNKADLLADYPAISNNRGRGFNYKLEPEATDHPRKSWDEDKISINISGLEKRIARLTGLPDYKRKDLAPYVLFIEEARSHDGKKWVKIVLYEDLHREKILLETKPIQEKCSDELMHDFIESGCCSNNFIPYPEKRNPHHRVHHHHHDNYSFVLRDGNGEDIAHSPLYRSANHRDKAMQLAACYLERICHNEGFHMIEHILLRPKGDDQITDERDKPRGGKFRLLDICLDRCDLLVKQDSSATVNYKFDIQVLPPEQCRDGKRWKVILHRINPPVAGKPVKVLERTFKEFELASDFIADIRAYGSELINFVIYKTRTDDRFYFKLKDKLGNTLVESSCFKTFSDKAVEEKAIPGKRTKCDTTIEDRGVYDEIRELKKFLAFENDLYCCEEPCDHNEDPYSFRVTVVLPCWPKRFRNKSFRKFVEKTIYNETPAHIQVNIFWLGITEMRKYEESYFDWLIEMAANDVPDIGICNRFIKQIGKLKNCDEHCEGKEELKL